MKRILTVLLAASLATACVTNRDAFIESRSNRIWIAQIKLGQTQAEVEKLMHRVPESRDVKTLADGTIEESWNYLTDYDSDTNTTLVFRGGTLAEITHTRWLGNGKFKG